MDWELEGLLKQTYQRYPQARQELEALMIKIPALQGPMQAKGFKYRIRKSLSANDPEVLLKWIRGMDKSFDRMQYMTEMLVGKSWKARIVQVAFFIVAFGIAKYLSFIIRRHL